MKNTLGKEWDLTSNLSQNFTSPEAGLHLCSLKCVSAHTGTMYPSSPRPQILGSGSSEPEAGDGFTHLPGTTVWITPVCCWRFARQSLKYQCDRKNFSVPMLNTTLQGVVTLESQESAHPTQGVGIGVWPRAWGSTGAATPKPDHRGSFEPLTQVWCPLQQHLLSWWDVKGLLTLHLF